MKATPYDGLSDSQLQPLKPFLELALTQKMWSLFDLRALRGSTAANLDLQRFIYGYDLLLVIPHPTASLEVRD